MKHARKLVLVDFNSTKSNESKKSDESLTNAINSLTNASALSRAYFGSNASSVSQLNNELSELLERKDLDPDKKLKLYNQSLTRYLFLQRESESGQPLGFNLPIGTPVSSGRSSPTNSVGSAPVHTPLQPIQPTPASSSNYTPINSQSREVLRSSKIPKYKTNLPRVSPMNERLRRNRTAARRDNFFVGWENRK